jgi:hypothetical protein
MAMFGYITELDTVDIDHSQDIEFTVPDGIVHALCRHVIYCFEPTIAISLVSLSHQWYM